MSRRIALWTLIGLAVACGWAAAAPIMQHAYHAGLFWTLVEITAPASLLARSIPLGMLWFILLNGAVYAIVGSVIEAAAFWKRRAA